MKKPYRLNSKKPTVTLDAGDHAKLLSQIEFLSNEKVRQGAEIIRLVQDNKLAEAAFSREKQRWQEWSDQLSAKVSQYETQLSCIAHLAAMRDFKKGTVPTLLRDKIFAHPHQHLWERWPAEWKRE